MSTIKAPVDDNTVPPIFERANLLLLPDPPLFSTSGELGNMNKNENWKAAFDWYNLFYMVGRKPLNMICRPCYWKVYYALKESKGYADIIYKNDRS
jgi:hypothetical protein